MLNIAKVRSHFPALSQNDHGVPATFFDAPSGTQVPDVVINRMMNYLKSGVAGTKGIYKTALKTDVLVENTRKTIQSFLNAYSKNEICFGQNMTSLTFAFSRTLANTWSPGDEIIVTDLDHEANISPWKMAAKEKAVDVYTWHFETEACTLNIETLAKLLTPKTKLLAITAASNINGSMPELKEIIELAHQNNTLVFVDATQLMAHQSIDVQELDCDFLVCSAYKFYGPHIGILYGKRIYMDNLSPYRIAGVISECPSSWETGTQNYEAMAGLEGAMHYLASISENEQVTSTSLKETMQTISEYELRLKQYFLSRLESFDQIKVYGFNQPENSVNRTPTFALSFKGYSAMEIATILNDNGFFAHYGHFNAPRFIERFKLQAQGGVVRIGFAHYNTLEEIEYLISTFEAIYMSEKTTVSMAMA
ncbi:cysteine desulfurase-like protein [Thiotrichales bacterium 19S3-7]|nr:cysteine desulfurase-like protein [Thiotrichales bacterium 19S3-7]MCF6802651.1 cysteine desulfurase-like protein [Thiotrichales bacterium 19S3-11]